MSLVLAVVVGLVGFIVPYLGPSHSFEVIVRPGEQVTVQPHFNAAWENCIIIEDFDTGQRLVDWNNKSGGHDAWTSPLNTSEYNKVYRIYALHKDGQPSGRLPWHPSAGRKLDSSEAGVQSYGWEDAGDGSFNDARADLRWRDG